MSASLAKRVKELEAAIDEILAGNVIQRSALGPAAVTKNILKAKSINASMLDVSELEAVSTKTGQLSITGKLTAGSGASILVADPNNGLYLGNSNPGLAPFSVGLDGALKSTSADIEGTVKANTLTANGSGQIAGWTIDPNKLSRGNVGIGDSSGYRIWSGNLSSPSLASFSVDNTGNLKSESGQIAGWSIEASRLAMDSGSVGMGSSGGVRIWAGSGTPASAPFRVESNGAMTATSATVNGTVNASSGSFTGTVTTSNLTASGGSLSSLSINGTLTISSGAIVISNGYIQDNQGSVWNQSGITLKSTGTFGDAIRWVFGGSTTPIFSIFTYEVNHGGVLHRVASLSVQDDGFAPTKKYGVYIRLINSDGSSYFRVVDPDFNPVFMVASNGAVGFKAGPEGIQTAGPGSYFNIANPSQPSGKIKIFNADGNHVGWIPVYSNIS